jgi:dihydrolipoamide dehydrogenase
MRVYLDKSSGKILGAEMACPAAEHMAHTLALAISQGLTASEVLTMPIYHPVLEEGMRTALRDANKKIQSSHGFDLSRCDDFQAEALD